jgi:outer membrane protein OmpA-like peptidoglycan-associated protein
MSDDQHKPDQGHGGGGDAHGDGHDKKGHKKHGGHHRHGGGHAEHEEGVPEWVVSFADNALLQMGFFVILFAMNVGPKGGGEGEGESGGVTASYLDAVIAIRSEFNNPVSLDSKDPNDLPLIKRMLQRGIEGDASMKGPPGDKPEVQAIRPSKYSENTTAVSFDLNQTTISPTGRDYLDGFVKRVRGQRWIIEVRGHCSSAESSGDSAKGMALSFERARSVAAALVELGVPWSQLRITAAADNERVVAKAYDSTAHRSNQRVEVIVTGDQVAPDPFTREGE